VTHQGEEVVIQPKTNCIPMKRYFFSCTTKKNAEQWL
jgi:hypothetical protein